jgi:hypothetical protein
LAPVVTGRLEGEHWEVVLDVVVSLLIRLWAKELNPRHARRLFSTVVGGGRTEGRARRQISLPFLAGFVAFNVLLRYTLFPSTSTIPDDSMPAKMINSASNAISSTRMIPHARQCRRSSLCGTPHPYLSRISLAHRHKSLGFD